MRKSPDVTETLADERPGSRRPARDSLRMRWLIPSLLALPLLVPAPAEAQFNPQGRKKAAPATPSTKQSTSQKGSAKSSKGANPATQPTTKPAAKPAGEDTVGTDALIERYTRAALDQPGSEFPLRRLAELARQRDGNLDRLLEDFAQRARPDAPGRYKAMVALAGLYAQAGRIEDATRTYAEAAQLQPEGTIAPLARARLLERSGQLAEARSLYERVVPKLRGNERELLLRDLIRVCLDLKDFDGAKRHHGELVKQAQGSMYVRAELGRELLQRGEVNRAIPELRAVAKAAQGDNRALGPALRDLGSALITAGQSKEALDVLRRARQATAGQPGLQREIDELLVAAYRREGRLAELIAEFESTGTNVDRLRTLGRLYEETGEVDKALGVYRRALTLDQRDVETRLKVVQLYELQGELDKAIVEYEHLVKANPADAMLVFRFAEALLGRGERDRALRHLERLEKEARGDEDTLVALTDFYERVGEQDRARSVLTRLSSSGLRDPRHLIELGSRHWRDGKREEAKRTWNRILTTQSDRARALVQVGEVYLDHDLIPEALNALREAVSLRPNDTRIKRSLAIALERIGVAAQQRERNTHWEEARKLWEAMLADSARDGTPTGQALARESRQHIVKLWQRMGQLSTRLSPLETRLKAQPPDLEAGRLLAEAQLHLRRYPDAEKTLRIVIGHAPGDVASLLALERSLVAQDKRDEAIAILQKLIAADPQKARTYYQRSARYAAEQYQDERAIEFAVRAVELNPDDAEGHLRLGEMYRRRQAHDEAIASFRRAIAKNDRLYPAYFDLAELLVGQGQEEEADRLLRRVVRTAPDEEFVARAARASLQLNLSRGTLAQLEGDLLPLALGRPGKPLYRRLLIEVYSTQAFPLVHRARSTDPAERQEALEQLARLGERAVKPLLDALGDERLEQQRTALELLAHVQSRSAAPALLAYAAGDGPADLRARAVIAAGASRDERSLPKLEALVFESGHAKVDDVSIAAAWALARLDGREANAARERLLQTNVPEFRTLAVLGLIRSTLTGKAGTANLRRALVDLDRVAQSGDAGPWPRAAAAYGWGALSPRGNSEGASTLISLLDNSDPSVRAHAMAALARKGHPGVERALAEALTGPEMMLRASALRAAALYASPSEERESNPDPLNSVAEARLDLGALLEQLLPASPSPTAKARALIRLREDLEEAALLAIRSSGSGAVTIAQALTARGGAPAFGALTQDIDEVSGPLRDEALRAAAGITRRVAPAYHSLLNHDSAEVRSASVAVLGLLADDDEARSAILDALRDSAPGVQNAALTALGRSQHAAARKALIDLLQSSPDWRLRRGAAHALAQSLGDRAPGDAKPANEVRDALRRAADHDEMAVVREVAARSLTELEIRPAERSLDRKEPGTLK